MTTSESNKLTNIVSSKNLEKCVSRYLKPWNTVPIFERSVFLPPPSATGRTILSDDGRCLDARSLFFFLCYD